MNTINDKPLRLAILQRICPSYRTALFSQLSSASNCETKLLIGTDVPNSKVRSTPNLAGINLVKMETRHIKLGSRTFTWHIGLVNEIRKFQPDVILCEGESHFIGYLQAIWYRLFYDRRVALIHWCFISLPGRPLKENNIRGMLKGFFRRFFDAFVLYSSYSKDCLIQLGQPEEKMFVATNVGNVKHFLNLSDSTVESSEKAKRILNIPEGFTSLYVGTLDEDKHPEVIIDLARKLNSRDFNFVILGTGPMLEKLRDYITRERLQNVFLRGQVIKELPLYYRSADVLLIPGRGGIVISEAMAFGIPVIVYQADGTEYDLVQDKISGIHLKDASVHHFIESIEFLRNNPDKRTQMSLASRHLVEEIYTTENMTKQILSAADYAKKARTI